jgi:hypothetical protein
MMETRLLNGQTVELIIWRNTSKECGSYSEDDALNWCKVLWLYGRDLSFFWNDLVEGFD